MQPAAAAVVAAAAAAVVAAAVAAAVVVVAVYSGSWFDAAHTAGLAGPGELACYLAAAMLVRKAYVELESGELELAGVSLRPSEGSCTVRETHG